MYLEPEVSPILFILLSAKALEAPCSGGWVTRQVGSCWNLHSGESLVYFVLLSLPIGGT